MFWKSLKTSPLGQDLWPRYGPVRSGPAPLHRRGPVVYSSGILQVFFRFFVRDGATADHFPPTLTRYTHTFTPRLPVIST